MANDDILPLGNVHIEFSHTNIEIIRLIIYGPIPPPDQVDKTPALQTLSEISASFNGGLWPGWNVFMQEIHNHHQGKYSGKSTVSFLPMIYMDLVKPDGSELGDMVK